MQYLVSDRKLIIVEFVGTFFWIILCFLCTDPVSTLHWQVMEAEWFYWLCSLPRRCSQGYSLLPFLLHENLLNEVATSVQWWLARLLFWLNQSGSIYLLPDKPITSCARMEVITYVVLSAKWPWVHEFKDLGSLSLVLLQSVIALNELRWLWLTGHNLIHFAWLYIYDTFPAAFNFQPCIQTTVNYCKHSLLETHHLFLVSLTEVDCWNS